MQVVTSQNLETVYANADFGRLTLDLSGSVYDGPTSDCGSGQFFSGHHSSAQGLASGFTHGLHTSLAGVKSYDSLGERGYQALQFLQQAQYPWDRSNCQTLKIMKERKLFFLANPSCITLNAFTNSATGSGNN